MYQVSYMIQLISSINVTLPVDDDADNSIALQLNCSSDEAIVSWSGSYDPLTLVQYELYCYDDSSELVSTETIN